MNRFCFKSLLSLALVALLVSTSVSLAEDVLFLARTEHEFSYADDIVIDYLQNTMELSVYVVNQDDFDMEADTVDIRVIVASATLASSALDQFAEVPLPIVTWEGWGFDDLHMSPGDSVGDSQTAGVEDTETIEIVDPTHSLSAGLTSEIFVTAEGEMTSYHYGKAVGEGRTIAVLPNGMDAIFAYNTGDLMFSPDADSTFNAPARRVGLYWFNDTPAKLNDNGWALFEAAMNWALGGTSNVDGNLVEDPGFERGIGDWYPWYVDESADWATPPFADMEMYLVSPGLAGSDSALFVEVIEPGLSDWYILVSKGVPMEMGKEYEMYLRAKAEEERTISVGVFENVSSGGQFHTEVITINEQDSLYGPFYFTYDPEPVLPGIKIQFGEFFGNVWVDDVAIYPAGMSEVETPSADQIPTTCMLSQNYPNPFNPSTILSYSLDRQQRVQLEVFDLLGRRVAALVNQVQAAGSHRVMFDGASLPAGNYFYKLQTESGSMVRKMTLLK